MNFLVVHWIYSRVVRVLFGGVLKKYLIVIDVCWCLLLGVFFCWHWWFLFILILKERCSQYIMKTLRYIKKVLKVCFGLCLFFDIISGVRFGLIVPKVWIFVLFGAVSLFVDFANCRFGLLYLSLFQVSLLRRLSVASESSRKSISNIGFCLVKSVSKLVHWYIDKYHVGFDSIMFIELQVSSCAL